VTVAQYTSFLNAVADTDLYGLYNANMETDLRIAGIARSGSDGSYTYSVIGSPNHPVTYVSWGDAARFSNWLDNGQPTGAQGPGTTESGAYALNGLTTTDGLRMVTRNGGAQWFLPSENEWYKAAFHQPAAQGGDVDNYWNYAMRTNSVPYSDQSPGNTPDNTRVANFFRYDGLANGYDDGFAVTGESTPSIDTQNYLTDVGAYSSSPSYYGTFDQGGNVFGWNDTLIYANSFGNRGGAWSSPSDYIDANFRSWNNPPTESRHIGFRVASIVPEPSVLAQLLCAIALLNTRLRKMR
jgi:formylglycine-generating enzyme required for sulfatase activity